MTTRLARTLTTLAIGIAGLAAIVTTIAAPASAATGVQLRQIAPTITGGSSLAINIAKTNPSAAAQNYTFTAYLSGKPVNIDPVNGGTIYASCGQSWAITETRVRPIDYFVVGGSNAAAISYGGVAPNDPGYCANGPSSPDYNVNVKVGTPRNLNVLSGAVDPDGDPAQITIAGFTAPTYGTLTKITLSTGRDGLRYSPNTGAVAGSEDNIVVTLRDQTGQTGTMNLNVTLIPSGGIG